MGKRVYPVLPICLSIRERRGQVCVAAEVHKHQTGIQSHAGSPRQSEDSDSRGTYSRNASTSQGSRSDSKAEEVRRVRGFVGSNPTPYFWGET